MREDMKTVNWSTYEKKQKKGGLVFRSISDYHAAVHDHIAGIYAWQMPRIQIGKAEQRSISHTVTADGKIEADKGKAVVVEAGIRIAEVCVTVGEKIQNNTVLLRLDTEDLKKLIEETTVQLEAQQQKLAAQKAGRNAEEQAAQAARERALQDLENTIAVQDEAVNRAWQGVF